MKKVCQLLAILAFIFLGFSNASAQGSNCSTADPFCTGTTYTFPNSTNVPNAGSIGCLSQTPNPAWYYMEIDQAGTMQFNISQATSAGSGLDVDFAIWGPYSSLSNGCSSIGSGTAPIQSSYSTSSVETVGLGLPGGSNSICATGTGGATTPPAVQPGQVYIVLITNYSGQAGNITFNQTGGTGSADCSIVCGVNSFTANPSACNPSTSTYSVSGALDISNPPASGTVTFTSSCGGTPVVVNLPATSPISYTINNLPANGAACTVSAVFSADGTCNTDANYAAPAACLPCSMDNISLNVGACSSPANTYGITGTLSFSNPPSTGTLTITTCGGQTQTLSAPFTSPVAINIPNIPADGTANCTVTASFSANSGCTITSSPFTEPGSCLCPADAGTYTVNMTGSGTNNYVLCYGDQISVTSDGNSVNPSNNGTVSGNSYAPGLGMLIYSCAPTPGLDPLTDPCYIGVYSNSGGNFSDLNDLSLLNSYPNGTFANNTIYLVPIIFYNQANTFYDPSCWDLGNTITITYLDSITGVFTENCVNGSATATITGGYPAVFGGNFNASNLQPATASFGNTSCASGGTILINGLQTGDMYSFDIADANGCTKTISGGPFVGPVQPGITPAGPFCNNDAPQQLTVTPTGGNWSGSGVGTSNGIFDPSAVAPGTYTIYYTANGCSLTDSISITVNPLPNANAGNDVTICLGESTPLAASGGATYSWSPTTGLSNPNIANPVATPGSTTTYTVTVTSAAGCVSTDQVTVTVSSVSAAISANPVSGLPPLVVNFTNNSTGASSYSWNYGDTTFEVTGNTSTTNTYTNYGTYVVEMVASNADGCTDTAMLTITVLEPFNIIIPNVITPNGDGKNDDFEIVYTGVQSMDVTIYDRWGLLMVEYDGLTTRWDCTHKGDLVSDGTYFYIINLVDSSNETHIFKGHVSVFVK